MATYDWSVAVWESGNTYTPDDSFPRPNEDMETKRLSTISKIKLANGSNAFITPETKYTKESFSMFWADTTTVFRTQLEGYITNGDKIKITTHSGEEFIVKILDYIRVWFSGIEDSYDIQVTMEQIS